MSTPINELPIELAREILDATPLTPKQKNKAWTDYLFSRALATKAHIMAERAEAGESFTWEDMVEELNAVAEAFGYEGGVPLPALADRVGQEHPLILADCAPLSLVFQAQERLTEFGRQMALQQTVRNSWNMLGDFEICIVEGDKGVATLKRPMSGYRLRKLMDEIEIRNEVNTMTAEAELQALSRLEERLNANQYRHYVLMGCFMERSARSDLHYLFRKGKPTIVVSLHGDSQARAIACLCFHPHGYYGNSTVGVMTPTDEVIAALLTMRGDERKFWAKSGQWHPSDPRSGI